MTKIWSFLKFLFVGSKLRLFLIGVLFGQAVMYPVILEWKNTPIIQGILIPAKDYDFVTPRKYEMNKVRSLYNEKIKLTVYIAPLSTIHEEYKKLSGKTDIFILGFYSYKTHDIWTIDSTDILIHEMRHIFEGGFHRSEENLKKYGEFKVFYGF